MWDLVKRYHNFEMQLVYIVGHNDSKLHKFALQCLQTAWFSWLGYLPRHPVRENLETPVLISITVLWVLIIGVETAREFE
jgi:hypothetical protein